MEVVILDDLKSGEWLRIKPEGSHWKNGFLFPNTEAEDICFKIKNELKK